MALENETPESGLNSLFGATPHDNFTDLPDLPDSVWARIVANAMDPDTPAAAQTLLPDESAVPGEDDPDLLYLDGADADPDGAYDDGGDGDDGDGDGDYGDGGAGTADVADPDVGTDDDNANGTDDDTADGSGGGFDGSGGFDDFGGADWGLGDSSGTDALGPDGLPDAQPWADPDPLTDGDSTDF